MNKPKTNQDSRLCAECGGDCCKESAGIYWPEQIAMTVENIVVLAKGDQYAIDWWDGDPRPYGNRNAVYFVRPAHTNAIGEPLDPSYGGVCVHLTENGCRLRPNERPIQCLKLIPIPLDERKTHDGCRFEEKEYDGKRGAALAWLPYQEIMDTAVTKLEDDNRH